MTVRVEVELVGFLKKMVNEKKTLLKFDGSVRVNDVVSELTNRFPSSFKHAIIDPELNDPRPNVLILLDGVEISVLDGLETRVKNGARMVLIPISHGG